MSKPVFQVGGSQEIRLIKSAFNGDIKTYRKDLGLEKEFSMKLLQSFEKIIKEAKMIGVKYTFSVSVVFYQVTNENDITDPPVVFRSEILLAQQDDEVQEQLSKTLIQLSNKIDEFVANGSGWVIHHFKKLDLSIFKYDPLKASSYIKLPKWIEDKKACLNIHNTDEKCFVWSVLAALHPVTMHSYRTTCYEGFENDLNMKNISFPVKIKDIGRFEMQNQVSVNVFGYDEKKKIYPVRNTKIRNMNQHVNLLLINENEKSHYVLIKNLIKLLGAQVSNHKSTKWFCSFCIQHFSSEDILNEHLELCRVRILLIPRLSFY